MGHGQAASGETDWPVDDVEEEEEQRKGPDEDVVVEGQLVAVPVVLREPLVQVVLLWSDILTVTVLECPKNQLSGAHWENSLGLSQHVCVRAGPG